MNTLVQCIESYTETCGRYVRVLNMAYAPFAHSSYFLVYLSGLMNRISAKLFGFKIVNYDDFFVSIRDFFSKYFVCGLLTCR